MNAWQVSATFSTLAHTMDRVYKRGKVFQAGDYPDKQVSVTADQLREGARGFKPVPLNIEHLESVLDGKLGELVALDVQDDGAVYGTVSMPLGIAALFGDGPVPVSVEMKVPECVITGLALAKHPRITDAAIFTAVGVQPSTAGTTHMNIKERLLAAFTKAVDEIPEAKADFTAPPPVLKADAETETQERLKAEIKARKDAERELERLKAKIEADAARAEQEKLQADSKKFAERYVQDRRVLPAQADALAAQYVAAFTADAQAGAEGKALKTLQEFIEATPQHRFTQEEMPPLKVVNGSHAGEKELTPERVEALLAQSSLGRQALKREGNARK